MYNGHIPFPHKKSISREESFIFFLKEEPPPFSMHPENRDFSLPISLHPITTLVSSEKSYAGTSKFSGAGPFLARPETS